MRLVSRLARPGLRAYSTAQMKFGGSSVNTLPGNRPLKEADPVMYELIKEEHQRQLGGIELIASENFTSRAVMEVLGSVLTNKYAEGLPGARYYGGNEVVDKVENLCRDRALEAYRLDPKQWGVNVQPYSGSSANWALYTGILQPGDRMMGLDLPHGGHLTHGFYTAKKKVSSSSVYFQSMPYRLGEDGTVDFDMLQKTATLFMPKLLIAGGSAYPREWNYAKFREVADSVGAYLLMDMAHISGLVAAGVLDDPFKYADFVTTTTHKSLRGPRSGLIFFKKETTEGKSMIEEAVNNAVFPACQGGPHINKIGGVAAQLAEVMTPEFKEYSKQVIANSKAMAEQLKEYGYTLSSGGTDNHLVLMNLRPKGITGSKVEKMCDRVHITVNKNSVVGDKSAVTPGGVRLGAPAMTTRGLKENDFKQIATFLHRGIEESLKIQEAGGGKMKLKAFEQACFESPVLAELENDVHEFSKQFPFPGFENPYEAF